VINLVQLKFCINITIAD